MPVASNKVTKKAQLTNPRDAKVCQKLLQFDVLTTLSLTILAYLHSFSCQLLRLTPFSGGKPTDIDVVYIPLKSAFNGLQFRR